MNDAPPGRLRLNVIEELMFWDDRPAYPWSFFVRLRFEGVIERAAFERAVETVVGRHVLLHSVVQQHGKRLYFVPQAGTSPQMIWLDEAPCDQLPESSYLDITREIGLRVFIRQNATHADVTFQVHHSACDGLGAFQMAGEAMVQYAGQVCAESGLELPSLDQKRMFKRGKWGVTWRNFGRTMRDQFVGLRGARQFLQRKPVPLIPCTPVSDEEPVPKSYPSTFHHWFDRSETDATIRTARRRGCSVNDWLACCIFLAVADWRKSSVNGVDENDWIRMMVPISLRGSNRGGCPVANIVSSIFLDRRGVQFENPEELLVGIHDEMQLIKRRNLGLTFPYSLKLARLAPGGLRKATRKDECSMSLIFTNPGRLFVDSVLPRDHEGRLRVGNLILQKPELVSPLRPYNVMTFSAFHYAGQLGMAVNYDARVADEDVFRKCWEMLLRSVPGSDS